MLREELRFPTFSLRPDLSIERARLVFLHHFQELEPFERFDDKTVTSCSGAAIAVFPAVRGRGHDNGRFAE